MNILDYKKISQKEIDEIKKNEEIEFYSKKNKNNKKIVNRPKKYREYIRSDYWKKQRDYNINFFSGKCALCNRIAKTSHHRTYKYKDEKENKNIVALCFECHDLFHKNYTYSRIGGFFYKS